MKIIGLTGGIASGKSTVATFLQEMGAAIIDADQLSREAVRPGSLTLAAIVGFFGREILSDDGTLDRKKLGDRIFTDPAGRHALEEMIHPEIRRLARERLDALREAGVAVAIYMAPLLIESGLTAVDEIWVVYVDRETQIERLKRREGLTREEALLRLAAQMPLEEKAKLGNFVIDNRGGIKETEEAVRHLWEQTLEGCAATEK